MDEMGASEGRQSVALLFKAVTDGMGNTRRFHGGQSLALVVVERLAMGLLIYAVQAGAEDENALVPDQSIDKVGANGLEPLTSRI